MKITVNGGERSVEGGFLAELLDREGIAQGTRFVAVAVNGEVVRSNDWRLRKLTDGDRIEIVCPVRGG